jgi:thiol-disulfide isomerase/thioredoxin
MIETTYLERLAANEAAEAMKEARQLVSDHNAEVAEAAQSWIASVEYKTKPLDLRFPDLDGREVDLSKYRGKVVLLDFWATWCVPCMEQMPHLVEVFEKYHAQGFEVIGVTDDLPPRDPAKPRAVEKTVPQLKEFLAKHQMPWPQLWDTRAKKAPGPKGLLRQFGIHSLPTYLLFDRNGMFVTSDLKGDKLEAEVRRLLGL